YNEAMNTFETIGYKRGAADVTKDRCTLEIEHLRHQPIGSDSTRAAKLCKSDVELYKDIGVKRGIADAHGNLGILYHESGYLTSAHNELAKALQIDQEIGYKLGMARQYANLGRLFITERDRKSAVSNLNTACSLMNEIQ